METTKYLALVDDHVIIRNGLKELIEKLGPYQVSHQFDGGNNLLESLQSEPLPDLIILDISMPQMDGYEVLTKLNERNITIPVLVLTLNDSEDLIIKLFRAGARGYLKKNCQAFELKNALNEIFTTGYYHNEFLVYSLQHTAARKSKQEIIFERLTEREKEFLKLVCDEKEYTYQQIADKMHVHTRTIDGYRESVFGKLEVQSKTGLVLFIFKNQLLEYLQ